MLDKFSAGKPNANPLNILVLSQLLGLHTAYQFNELLRLLPFGRNLNGKLRVPNFGEWDLYSSKAHPRLPKTSQHNVLRYLPSFGRNLKGGFGDPQFWGLVVLGES